MYRRTVPVPVPVCFASTANHQRHERWQAFTIKQQRIHRPLPPTSKRFCLLVSLRSPRTMASTAGYHTFDDKVVAAVVPPTPPSSSSVEMKSEDFAALQQLPGNDRCVDCGTKSPDWGSPALGILFCLKCSGVHRYVFCFWFFVW